MIVVENEKDLIKLFELKQKESIIFINCKDCNFIIPNKINKIIIYDCHNCKFSLYTAISSLELCKSTKLYLLIYGTMMTTQIDLVHESEIHYIKAEGFVISCGTEQVLVSTPYRRFTLPFHIFMQQFVTNLETWITKRREECLDPEGYLLLN